MQIIQEKTKTEMCSHVRIYGKSDYHFHWHEKYEIFQVLKHPCRFLVNGQLIHAREGDIIAINQQVVHRLMADHEDTCVRIIQFPLRILLHSSSTIKPLKPHITREELAAIPHLQETLDRLFPVMDLEHRVLAAEENPFLQSLCSAVYFLLMRYFAEVEPSSAASNERREFYKVVEFANQHYTADINIQTIAARLYIPRGRLATLFRKYSGMDLNEYINTLRIKHANQLLMSGSRITEAATESGFQSIRTFNNIYKAHMGLTPSEYVKSIQEQ